ncbi:MAG: ATP-binding protein [Symploca sp. SIO2D2]|nr:ATP-binding protein [Symploca sp. SIO2D2]
MKIKRIEYQDQEYEWKIETLELLPNLTLLVGGSGAGKTLILKSILNLKKIANGESLNGVKWDVWFSAENGANYQWKGEFETQKDLFIDQSDNEKGESDIGEDEFNILEEFLYKDNKEIIRRHSQEIFFNDVKTPKLSPSQSIIELFQQEEDVAPAKENLDKIIFSDSDRTTKGVYGIPPAIFKKHENSSLSSIQNSDLPVSIKLSLIYRYLPEVFKKIKNKFIEIFPQVEDIKIDPLSRKQIPIALAQFLNESTFVSLKEKGVGNWIIQDNISSGMYKTLIYLSELFLVPEGSVILIDEFENSLGVNCIDSVTDLILENRNSQFIITSHHPYIINNISPAFWKIIISRGGLITAKNPEYFHISKSRQKAFLDLINVLEDYYESIED